MINKLRQFVRGRRGASMVEFAVALPLILVLAFGLWEFGRIFDTYLVATNAAREGVRWAALGQDEAAVQDRVADYLAAGYASRLSTGELTVGTIGLSFPDGTGDPGAPVQVAVPITVKLFMPGPLALGSTYSIEGSATMRLQTQSAQIGVTPVPTQTPTATATSPGGKKTATATPTETLVPVGTPTATSPPANTATATATATATHTATSTHTPTPTKTPKK